MPGGGDTQAPTGPASLSATATSSSSVAAQLAGCDRQRRRRRLPRATGAGADRADRRASRISTPADRRRRRTRTRCAPTTPPGTSARPRRRARRRRRAATRPRPSVPTGLHGDGAEGARVSLTWNASNDNVGVVGYDVYRNGTRVAGPAGRRTAIGRVAGRSRTRCARATLRATSAARPRASPSPRSRRTVGAPRSRFGSARTRVLPCATRKRRPTSERSCSRRCSACPSRSRPCSSRPRSTT